MASKSATFLTKIYQDYPFVPWLASLPKFSKKKNFNKKNIFFYILELGCQVAGLVVQLLTDFVGLSVDYGLVGVLFVVVPRVTAPKVLLVLDFQIWFDQLLQSVLFQPKYYVK